MSRRLVSVALSAALAAGLLAGVSAPPAAAAFPSDNPSGRAGLVGASSPASTIVPVKWYQDIVYTVTYGTEKTFYFGPGDGDFAIIPTIKCVNGSQQEVGTFGGGSGSSTQISRKYTFTETCYFINTTGRSSSTDNPEVNGYGWAKVQVNAAAPGAPGRPSSSPSQTSITWSWSAAAENGGAITNYTLDISPDPSFPAGNTTTVSTGTTRSYTYNTTAYQYFYARVKATNSGGTGAFSTTSTKARITALPQTITVNTDPFSGLGSIPYNKSTYTFDASASSGLAVAYTSADTSVCAVGASSGVVELVGAGTCTIQMDQAGGVDGGTTYAPATQVTSSVTVTPVAVSASNPGAVEVSTREYDGNTSASLDTSSVSLSGVLSGDTVTLASTGWSYASADAGTGIAVSGGSYSLGGANSAGYSLNDSNLPTALSGAISPKSVTVTADDETFTYGGSAFTQSFTTSSLVGSDAVASVTYSYEGTGSTSYGPSATQPTEAGTYEVTPSAGVIYPGNSANYELSYAAGSVTGSQASQTVTLVGSGTTSAKVFGAGPVEVEAWSSLGAGYPIEFTSSDESVCTVSGGDTPIGGSYFGTVAFTGAAGGTGTCVVSATQEGDRNYASDSDSRTFTVTRASQPGLSIFSGTSAVFGTNLTLSGGGGLSSEPLSWGTSTPGVCSVSGSGTTGTLVPVTVGTCTVTLNRAADDNYLAASQVTQNVMVAKRNQVVAFTSGVPIEPKSFQTYTARFASSLGGSYVPTVTVAASSAAYCQVIDDSTPGEAVVYFSAAGPCTLTATQAGDSNTNSGSATQTIVVDSINQNITFNPIADQVFGVPPFSLGASTSSGRPVTYTSSTTGVCTVGATSGLLTIKDKGVCTVTVSRAADAQYAAANSVQHSFTVAADLAGAPFVSSVSPGDTTITTSFIAPGFTGAPSESIAGYEVTATPTSGSAITQPCSDVTAPLVCTMTGLANGTDYRITVAAVNSSGVGASSTASSLLRPATAANAVTGAYAVPDINGTSVHLYWDQLPNTVATLGGGTFTSYDVYVRQVGGSWPGTPEFTTSAIGTTEKEFTNLTTGQSYEFKIVAITTANSTALTGNTTIVTEYPSTVPGAVTELTLTETSDTSAVITWEVPVTDGGAEITSYDVSVPGLRNCSIDPATEANRCVFTGMELGRTYTFTVTATNRMGEGPGSRVSMTTPPPPPADYDGPAITDQTVPEVVLSGAASWMVTENGRPVLTSLRPNRAKTGWIITGTGFDTEVVPLNAAKQPVGLGTSDNLQVPQGGWIKVTGDDYRPDTLVKAFLVPMPEEGRVATRSTTGTLYIGSFDANARGRINGEVYVPTYATAGNWVLQLVGQENISTLRSTNLALTIIDATPGTDTFLTQRAGFFKGQKAVLSAKGKKKLRALLRGIPEGASIETIAVTGVSVNMNTTRANLKLASQRADTIAEYLDKRGLTGTIDVAIYTQITIGTPRTSATAPQPLQTKQGKPLTTTSITFQTPEQ